MVTDQKKPPSTKNKKSKLTRKESKELADICTLPERDKLFMLYCNGMKIKKIGEMFGVSEKAMIARVVRWGWVKRKQEILNAVSNDVNQQIVREKTNQALAGLLIKKMNTRRIIKEYQAFQKKGRIPSYLASNVEQYRQSLMLADQLMEMDKLKIEISGKVKHDVLQYTPEQIDRILDALLEVKGVPNSPLDENE